MSDRTDRVRASYRAYETRDRELLESLLADDFTFSAPPDPLLDRAGYFERCWPNAQHLESFDLTRLIEQGDTVVATYEATRTDGTRFTNTEVFTVAGDRIRRVEVYFGWNLEC
jgi:ketosteroid isomerase-like protein